MVRKSILCSHLALSRSMPLGATTTVTETSSCGAGFLWLATELLAADYGGPRSCSPCALLLGTPTKPKTTKRAESVTSRGGAPHEVQCFSSDSQVLSFLQRSKVRAPNQHAMDSRVSDFVGVQESWTSCTSRAQLDAPLALCMGALFWREKLAGGELVDIGDNPPPLVHGKPPVVEKSGGAWGPTFRKLHRRRGGGEGEKRCPFQLRPSTKDSSIEPPKKVEKTVNHFYLSFVTL